MKKIFTFIFFLSMNTILLAQVQFKVNGGFLKVTGDVNIVLENTRWINNAVVIANDGTVLFTGNASNLNSAIEGENSTTFYNLTLNKSSNGVQLNQAIQIDNVLKMMSGSLDLNTYDLTLGSSNGLIMGEHEDSRILGPGGGEVLKTLILNAPTNVNPGNIGFEITSASNLGMTTIKRGHIPFATPEGDGILRYFDVEPSNNTNLDANIRMYYFDAEINSITESELDIWRKEPGTWDFLPYDARDLTANWLEKEDVSHLSNWTLAKTCQLQTFYADTDNDGFGDPDNATIACFISTGFVLDNSDCDDTDSAVNPNAIEICNGVDDDCDGLTDTSDPSLVDNIDPVVSCKDVTIQIDASGTASISENDVVASKSDNCGSPVASISQSAYDCSNVGSVIVTVEVDDGNGNTGDCTATVTVLNAMDVDGIDDQIVCDSYKLPAIFGTSLTGNERYFTGPDGTGTALDPGDMITSTQIIYIYDETGTTPNCSDEESFTVTVNTTPEMPGAISGPSTLCEGSMNVLFTVDEVSTVDGYNWYLDGMFLETGDHDISLDVGSSGGELTVLSYNECGDSPASAGHDIAIAPGFLCALTLCTQEDLFVDNEMINFPLSPDVFHAIEKINTDGVVFAPKHLVLNAGESISFLEGFETMPGAELLAQIESCSLALEEAEKKIKSLADPKEKVRIKRLLEMLKKHQ